MNDEKLHQLIQRAEIERSLKEEFESSFEERINRYLEVKPHEIVADTHFARVSAECSLLFRDGHYFGCIALTQAVAEALVRFLHNVRFNRHSTHFERNVKHLHEQGFISSVTQDSLLKVWDNRDDYHHLNPTIETNRQKLEELAKGKLQLLKMVENEIFAFDVVNGKLTLKYPEHWDKAGNNVNVFLRFEP